jgi:rod shape-determining protein MreC
LTPRPPQKPLLGTLPLRTISTRVTPMVLVMLALTLLAVDRMGAMPIAKLRIAMADTLAPALASISEPFETVADSFSGIRTMRQLKAENIRLKAENERLQQWYEAALKFQAQNKALHDLLNVRADPALSFVTTRVVSDPGGTFVKSVLLPVGSRDGVGKGNAVMSGRGLIGRVTEVGERSARVLLITDLNSRIPVVIQNTRTHAILAGKNAGFLRLERLPIDSSLAVGQRIVTSGDGGQLPPDIPIGTITGVGPNGIYVQPLTDIDTVTYVQVVNAQIDQGLVTGDITPPQTEHAR